MQLKHWPKRHPQNLPIKINGKKNAAFWKPETGITKLAGGGEALYGIPSRPAYTVSWAMSLGQKECISRLVCCFLHLSWNCSWSCLSQLACPARTSCPALILYVPPILSRRSRLNSSITSLSVPAWNDLCHLKIPWHRIRERIIGSHLRVCSPRWISWKPWLAIENRHNDHRQYDSTYVKPKSVQN